MMVNIRELTTTFHITGRAISRVQEHTVLRQKAVLWEECAAKVMISMIISIGSWMRL
jgi:hypothetical protein